MTVVAKRSRRFADGLLLPTRLSNREPQVLLFLAYGKTNKEIVAILNVSVRTIETYRARLMLKGNLHSAPHLVRCAFRNNVI